MIKSFYWGGLDLQFAHPMYLVYKQYQKEKKEDSGDQSSSHHLSDIFTVEETSSDL